MNTPRRLRTMVLSVSEDSASVEVLHNSTTPISTTPVDSLAREILADDRSRFRPSDLLPWSDPYIASLVHKLQDEVRQSRRSSASQPSATQSRFSNEAEMPWNEPFEYESDTDAGFSIDTDDLLLK